MQIHKLFYFSVLLKGLNGIVEAVIGIFAFFISKATLLSWVYFITAKELNEEPSDFLAGYLINSVQNYSSSSQYFIAVYLLTHGVLKLFLVASLLQRRLWAFPTAIVIFSLFFVYQVYEYFLHPQIFLIVLSVVDVFVVVLTYYEYRSMLLDTNKSLFIKG